MNMTDEIDNISMSNEIEPTGSGRGIQCEIIAAKPRVDSRGRPKAVTSVLKEISAENVEILGVHGVEVDNSGKESVALIERDTGALAIFAERQKIESQLNSVYYLATNVTAINDRGQLLLYNPMAALKAVELLIDIKGLRDNSRNARNIVQVAGNVRSIDLASERKSKT
jgi:hypothetical protein